MSAQIRAPIPDARPEGARRTQHGILLMIAGVSLIATMDLFVKLASERLGVVQISWSRYAIQLVVLMAMVYPTSMLSALRSPIRELHLVRALLLLTGNLSFMAALAYMPLAEANILGFLAPLLLTALAYPVLGERVGVARGVAVVVGFLGALVVLRPGGEVFGWIAILPLAMAVSAAAYHVLTPIVRRVEDPAISLYFLSAIAVGGLGMLLPWSWIPPSPAEWGSLIAIGCLSAGGHVLMVRAMAHAPASTVAPFLYCHLIWALLYGHVFFDEFPDLVTLVGAALVVAAGLVVYRTR